jgi:hypothetical protein
MSSEAVAAPGGSSERLTCTCAHAHSSSATGSGDPGLTEIAGSGRPGVVASVNSSSLSTRSATHGERRPVALSGATGV